jgi:hypothetical protein
MLYPGQCLGPCEIEILARVCQTVCKEQGFSLKSTQAQRIASHLLKLFMNGLTSEEELLDAERNRATRVATIQPMPPNTMGATSTL